jgi:hypothetical protein
VLFAFLGRELKTCGLPSIKPYALQKPFPDDLLYISTSVSGCKRNIYFFLARRGIIIRDILAKASLRLLYLHSVPHLQSIDFGDYVWILDSCFFIGFIHMILLSDGCRINSLSTLHCEKRGDVAAAEHSRPRMGMSI